MTKANKEKAARERRKEIRRRMRDHLERQESQKQVRERIRDRNWPYC